MTREEAIAKLRECERRSEDDAHYAHMHADGVLCEFLRSLGYGDVADAFEDVGKWYS